MPTHAVKWLLQPVGKVTLDQHLWVLFFSAGWTPCIGPVYGAVLTMAANTGDVVRAGPMLAIYSLGLGVPLF
ncbi:MAG: cytochrome c biogenesis protein CcdA [Anaerolineae bacterium]